MSVPVNTTGIVSLDDLLGGGVLGGDNIVWVAAHPADLEPIEAAFLAVETGPTVATGPAVEAGPGLDAVCRRIDVRDRSGVVPDPEALEAIVLAADVGAGSRLVISSIDDLVVAWGAERAIEFYALVCPRLFDRGAIAYWSAGREITGPSIVEAITRIAQCVFELRDQRLRVRKAEGRPARVQGAVATVSRPDSNGAIALQPESAVGRVSEGIRRIRTARGMTQTQVAALAGVTPAAISQVESGRRGLSLDSLLNLSEALGTGVDELVGLGRRPNPWLARHDRSAVDLPTTPLFEEGPSGPGVHFVRLDPGATGRPPYAHKGVEMLLAASGLVLVDLGEHTPVLRAGDAAMVTDVAVRGWTNLGEGEATLFWVALPTQRDESDRTSGAG